MAISSTTHGIAAEGPSLVRPSPDLRAATGIVNASVLGIAFWSLVVLWWIA